MSKTDFMYLRIWCDSVTFCQRGLFYSPCTTHCVSGGIKPINSDQYQDVSWIQFGFNQHKPIVAENWAVLSLAKCN